ncbi:MAG: hypothetical protein K2Q26_04210 [Bdellovibrionales bacterium]|nr:hypothetical protein [Bdellovibrionales bacterium]
MKSVIFLAILGVFGSAHAALPPYFASVKKIETALKEVGSEASGVIQQIRLNADVVTVNVGNCQFDVYLKAVDTPNGLVGPAQYEVKAMEKMCLN